MHIVGLEIENYGRLKAVSMEPDETGAVIISGRNAQGKTSLLNAIWAALGGRAGNNAAKPVREGADEAKVAVDLGDMIVTRIWRNNTTHLEVRSKEGAVFKSPQALLDGFIGKLSFDPLAFTRLKDRDQKDALLQLVDLDIDLEELEARRDAAFELRTSVGQERKRLGEVQIDGALPSEEISVSALIDQISAAADQAHARRRIEDSIRSREAEREQHQSQIRQLQQRVQDIDMGLGEMREEIDRLPTPIDTAPLKEQIDSAEATNAAIRVNNARRDTLNEANDLDASYKDLTRDIAALDTKKSEALARVTFPVEGLGFDTGGVTFNGVPFSQASSAEQIRVSMAMAIAANPKLKVVRIMDGSLLDDDGMKIITEMAEEHGFQVWIERVANGDGVGFVIEDGELAGAGNAVA